MARSMYGASFWSALGLTTNCCTIAGYATPMTRLETSSRTSAPAGSRKLRTKMFAKKAIAHTAATKTRIVFGTSSAFTSV
jgi:hypothetical protein